MAEPASVLPFSFHVRTAFDRIRLVKQTLGQDLIEYALLGAFIAMMCTAAAPLGHAVNDWYAALSAFAAANSGSPSSPSGTGNSSGRSNCSATGASASNGRCQ